MNWSLIFKLSMFGLAMGIATVFAIPSTVEPLFWLAIFVVCAYAIAKNRPGNLFVHGLMVSIVNSVWITTAHIVFSETYLAGHAQEAATLASSPLPDSPRLMMLMTGPVIGIASGIVLGFFSFVAGKIPRLRRSHA